MLVSKLYLLCLRHWIKIKKMYKISTIKKAVLKLKIQFANANFFSSILVLKKPK